MTAENVSPKALMARSVKESGCLASRRVNPVKEGNIGFPITWSDAPTGPAGDTQMKGTCKNIYCRWMAYMYLFNLQNRYVIIINF